jgi:hypothetical protein
MTVTLADVAAQNGPLSRKVLQYSAIMKQLVDKAKQHGFTERDWTTAMQDLVDFDHFQRIGNNLEVQTWPEYTRLLTAWAATAQWENTFKRITEVPGRVYLELEERSVLPNGQHTTVNSVSVYEFNAAGKLHHLDIYLQHLPFDPTAIADFEAGGRAHQN